MPRKLIKIFFTLFLLGGFPNWSFPVWAGGEKICQECHSQKFLRQNFTGFLETIVYREQSVYQAKLNPCPGVRSGAEDLFFTERRLQKYGAILSAENKGQIKVQELNKTIWQIEAELEILKKQRMSSLAELGESTAALRLSLQKVYEQIWQIRTEKEKRWLIGVGSLIFLFFFCLLLFGLKKLTDLGKNPVIIIFLTLSLGLGSCSGKSGEAPKGKGQERLEQALVIAQKRVKEIGDAYQKIILLIDLAKEYGQVDPPGAKQVLKLARKIATNIKEQNKEFIPRLEMVRSSLRADKINPEAIRELQEKMNQIQGSIFLLRHLAEEWLTVDHKEGRQLLEVVTDEVWRLPAGDLRDRELKALAEIWSTLEIEEALKLINKIKDPFLRATGLGRLALIHPDAKQAIVLLQGARQESSRIRQPWRQVQALIRLSAWTAQINQEEGENYAEFTWQKIEALGDQQLQSWAGQEMIKNWAPINSPKAETWLKKIPEKFAESRVYSLRHLARPNSPSPRLTYLHQALAEAKRIEDEYERGKLSALVLEDLLRLDQREAFKNLRDLKDPHLFAQRKAKILRTMVAADKGGGLKLAQNIAEEEIRYPLILELLKDLLPNQRGELLNLYKEAFQFANYISDPYQRWLILRDLNEAWGRLDADGKVTCLREAEKTTPQIPSGQKAEVLSYLAASWKSLDEEKSKSLLEKHALETYDPQNILEEIRLWGKLDIKRAEALAQTIGEEFLFQKIQAYKEIARFLKKEKPQEAWKYLEMAWQEAKKTNPNFPIMVELVKEGAAVNKKGVGELISQIPMRRQRDLLLQELGKTLLKTGQISDLETVWQISREIADTSLVLDLYEKIRTLLKTKKGELGLSKSFRAGLWILQNWSAPKEKVEEELLQISDQKLKARLLAFWATNLSRTNEEQALPICQKISEIDQEAYSFALYKIGSHLRQWNREKGRNILEQALRATEKIKGIDLKIERTHQLVKEIYFLDQNLAQSMVRKLSTDFPSAAQDLLLTLVEWNPHLTKKIAQEATNPYDQAQIILRGAEVLMTKGWLENNKLLEAAAQWAKKIDHARYQGEVAEILILCAEQKGWELWRQIKDPEERVKILIRAGQRKNYLPPEEANKIFEKALAETLRMTEAHKRIKFMMEIARYWTPQDKQKGKEILSQAYHLAINSPEFRL
ncbi:MAG: hypothetical protein ACUVWV_05180 [Thermodesulfobacteriota bacterium]